MVATIRIYKILSQFYNVFLSVLLCFVLKIALKRYIVGNYLKFRIFVSVHIIMIYVNINNLKKQDHKAKNTVFCLYVNKENFQNIENIENKFLVVWIHIYYIRITYINININLLYINFWKKLQRFNLFMYCLGEFGLRTKSVCSHPKKNECIRKGGGRGSTPILLLFIS